MYKFKEETLVHAKSVVTALKLNYLKTVVDETEIKLPQLLNQTWFAQKFAEALRE